MAAANPKSGGIVIPHAPKWHQRLGAFLVFVALRALLLTNFFHHPHRHR